MTAARHRLTASRVELADAGCLFWARPDVPLPARTENAASSLGSATHEAAQLVGEAAVADDEDLGDVLRDVTRFGSLASRYIEQVAAKWNLPPAAIEALSELHETWAAWWGDFVPEGATVRYEAPYAWDTARWTARELPSSGQRNYSAASWGEVPCTIDAVIVDADGKVTVVDLKTGRRRQPAAAEHAQLASGALCVARTLGVDEVRVVLAKITPGRVFVDSAVLDAMTLDARAAQLGEHVRALPTAAPVPGPHCSSLYCPALATCEGPRALALSAPALARALPARVETEEQAAAALLASKPLESFVAELKRQAVAWADAHGGAVRMPDGSVMRRVAQVRRSVDAERVMARLSGTFGPDVVESLVKVKRSVSITELERAAAALAPPGRKKAEVEARRVKVAEVMSGLESTGGIKVSTFAAWESEAPALPGGGES